MSGVSRSRAYDVDLRIQEIVTNIESEITELISLLRQVETEKLYRHFKCMTLHDYVVKRGLYRSRMGRYIEKIVQNAALSGYMINHPAEAKEIGITKFIELSEHGNVTEANLEYWIGEARRHRTIQDLRMSITGGSNSVEHPAEFRCLFASNEDYRELMRAIEIAKLQSRSEDTGVALRWIAAEFVSTYPQEYAELLEIERARS